MKKFAAVVLMLMSAGAFAQVNKCIDKSGKVVGYGNECPAGSRAEQMAIQKGPPASAPQQKSLAERDADFKKRQVERNEAEKKDDAKRAATEQNKAACDQSRAYLKNLEAGQRIQKTDPKTGERTYMQDSEYAAEVAKTRAQVAQNCK